MFHYIVDSESYEDYKDIIQRLASEEEEDTDPMELADRIQTSYDENRLSEGQYDDLMLSLDELL